MKNTKLFQNHISIKTDPSFFADLMLGNNNILCRDRRNFVCGDALNGRIVFESDILVSLVNNTAGNNMMLRVFMYLFDAMGVIDFLTFVANDTVATSFDRGNDVMLRDCLGTMCGFWALCPDEDFDSAPPSTLNHQNLVPAIVRSSPC